MSNVSNTPELVDGKPHETARLITTVDALRKARNAMSTKAGRVIPFEVIARKAEGLLRPIRKAGEARSYCPTVQYLDDIARVLDTHRPEEVDEELKRLWHLLLPR